MSAVDEAGAARLAVAAMTTRDQIGFSGAASAAAPSRASKWWRWPLDAKGAPA
jgi:hypothetical protein